MLGQLQSVLQYLLPNGKICKNNKQFLIGSIQGESGESLKVELQGSKAGMCAGGKKSLGLVRRRIAEVELYLRGCFSKF